MVAVMFNVYIDGANKKNPKQSSCRLTLKYSKDGTDKTRG